MKFSLEKSSNSLYYFVITSIVLVLAFFYYNSQKALESNKLMVHSIQVISKNNDILLNIINIESGYRGFLLSRDENFLEQYNKSKKEIVANLNLLKKLTKDNQKQQQYILLLNKETDLKIATVTNNIEYFKKNNFNIIEKKELFNVGKYQTDSIRKLTDKLNKNEVQLFNLLKLENDRLNKYSSIILLIILILFILISILIINSLKKQTNRNNELSALTDSQKSYSKYTLSLIEASLDPLVTINTGGKITDMNEATVRITGIERNKLIGSDFFDYFTEQQKAREVYQEVFEKGSVADSPLTLRHKDGKLTDVLFNGSVYKDDDGNVMGVVIVARDIAEQKWALDLRIANKELEYQNNEKEKRANELFIANEELAFQNNEKEKRANELSIANEELAYQNDEKEKRAAELVIANKELAYQNDEKEKRAAELVIANKELEYQNDEKEKRANELLIANEELAFQNDEKEKRANELLIANEELEYQNTVKEKRAAELIIANEELAFQNNEKEKRAAELVIANKELLFQTGEKQDRAAELVIANKELLFQTGEKQDRAAELVVADKELDFQNKEKEKRKIENKALEVYSNSLKQASQYSLSLIEASRDPLVTINKEGKITDMNEATVRIMGIERKKLIGSDFFDYFTDQQKAREVYQEVFEKGSVADSPLTLQNKDGKLTDVLFNGSVYKDDIGNVLGVVIVARDIAEQKRIENELIEAKISAEKATAIAEDAQTKAENATLIAREAVKSKQQFLSNMSHEIRTPMNAIIGFTKVILKTGLTAKQKEYLTAIKISGDALIVLINDILDLAKVDSGKMTFEQIPFKLNLSISLMLHLFETKIHEKNLKLVLEFDKNIPEVLAGDPVRLNQIILNLVSNAIKFTSIGQITVSINMLNEDENNVFIQFSVKDTGIGISSEKIEGLFENFQQATSSTSRIFGGTGLGLAIVKQLVEPQGGTLNVESTVDVGSTFSFILPFKKTDETLILESEMLEVDNELKDIKVLVVEDLELNQLLIRTLLDDFGFESEIAANGKLAIERLETKDFDIILMDLQMPEMNGFEATEYIRNKLKLTIPIIALTADVTTIDAKKCINAGMNDYISKPVDEGKLFRKMIALIQKPMSEETNSYASNSSSTNVDLSYLMERTKSNPKLMSEMISIYLEQTPQLIQTMNEGFKELDWGKLYASAHKMIPSFSIMGIDPKYENLAKKIQEYASNKDNHENLGELIKKLEIGCEVAYIELNQELKNINTKLNEKYINKK
jgi:PAS domain S-box-containing protein